MTAAARPPTKCIDRNVKIVSRFVPDFTTPLAGMPNCSPYKNAFVLSTEGSSGSFIQEPIPGYWISTTFVKITSGISTLNQSIDPNE